MDLGAPILNVQVSSTKATDTTVTAAAKTSTASTTNLNVFNPSNPIVQDVPIDKTPIILPPSKDKPIVQPIFNSSTVNIVKREDESASPVVMIAVVTTIIAVIVIGGLVGYYLYRRHMTNLIARKGQHASTPVDQSSRANMTPASPEMCGDEIFEDQYQYQPNPAVIDIFGRGNDIIKKGNEADMIDEVIKEDFEEDMESSERDENQSSGLPPSLEGSNGRTGSGGSNSQQQHTTRFLVTNARESTLNENVPLGSFSS